MLPLRKNFLSAISLKASVGMLLKKTVRLVFLLLSSVISKAMSLIAMEFYGNPQKKLKLLAFTGTKGKTTAAYFAYNILSQGIALQCSTMNTTLDGKTFFKSALTTPESIASLIWSSSCQNDHSTSSWKSPVKPIWLNVSMANLWCGSFLNISPDHIGLLNTLAFEKTIYYKRLLMEIAEQSSLTVTWTAFLSWKEQVENQDHDFYGGQSDNQIENSKPLASQLQVNSLEDMISNWLATSTKKMQLLLDLPASVSELVLRTSKRNRYNPSSWSVWKSSLKKMELRSSSTTPTMVIVWKNSSMWLKLIKLEKLYRSGFDRKQGRKPS